MSTTTTSVFNITPAMARACVVWALGTLPPTQTIADALPFGYWQRMDERIQTCLHYANTGTDDPVLELQACLRQAWDDGILPPLTQKKREYSLMPALGSLGAGDAVSPETLQRAQDELASWIQSQNGYGLLPALEQIEAMVRHYRIRHDTPRPLLNRGAQENDREWLEKQLPVLQAAAAVMRRPLPDFDPARRSDWLHFSQDASDLRGVHSHSPERQEHAQLLFDAYVIANNHYEHLPFWRLHSIYNAVCVMQRERLVRFLRRVRLPQEVLERIAAFAYSTMDMPMPCHYVQ